MLNYQINILEEADGVTLTFPDIPEAITCGDSVEDAMSHAADAVLTAFMIYEKDRRVFPMPKTRTKGKTVFVPMVASLKIMLHNAMIEGGMRKVDLAKRTGWANSQVERILDPRYVSKIDLIETALAATGKAVTGKLVNL